MPLLVKKQKVRTIRSYGFSGAKYSGLKDKPAPSQNRIRFLILFFIVFGALIVFRLIKLQLIDGQYYYALAYDQHELFQQLYPERGTIFIQQNNIDHTGGLFPVATNKEFYLVYAVPSSIADPEAVKTVLFEVLDFSYEINKLKKEVIMPDLPDLTAEEFKKEKERLEKIALEEATDLFEAKLLERLSKPDDPYEPIQHRVSDKQVEKLAGYNLEGINWTTERARFYPEKGVGSHVLGFVGHTSETNLLQGYYGIEGSYDDILAGEVGFLRSELDNAGRWIATAGKEFKPAKDGSDIVLTIDKAIQYYACEQLYFGVNNYAADGGSIIIMEPSTGAILAMCSHPGFDPNLYNKVESVSVFNNPVLLNNYEPGSVFKPFTMAAALDKGKITPFTTYNDTGQVTISEYTIKNSDGQAHGIKNMTEVLEESLNTGTIFAARQIGQQIFAEYVRNFGFGRLTGIDLSPEGEGNISSLDKKNEIYMATGSYGQGITTTPLQLARAYATIANDGKLVQPYIIDRIIHPDGTEEKTQPKVVGQAISPKTSKQVGGMLVSVVQNGHAELAQVKGYLVAGKTGTAQVADLQYGGYGNQTIHTFIGYAPFDHPRFVMLVKLDHVKNVPYAANSTAPIFGKIAKFILDYYHVPPSVK